MAQVVKYSGDIPCLELIDTTGKTVRNYVHVQRYMYIVQYVFIYLALVTL